MTLDAADLVTIQRIAQTMAAETVRNVTRGTGGAQIAVPVIRPGAVFAVSQPGATVLVTPDGDVDPIPVVNATGFTLVAQDRVLIEWNPPQGVYATNVLRSQGGGDFVPVLGGSGTTDAGWSKTGHWTSIGRRVRAWGTLVFGSGLSTVGTEFTIGGLPFPVRSEGSSIVDGAIGHVYINDVSAVRPFDGRWVIAEGQTAGTVVTPSLFATPGFPILANVTSTAPMTWASGDTLMFNVEFDTD